MNLFSLSSKARRHLFEIRKFTLQRWGKKQSTLYVADLVKTFYLIAEMPTIGKRFEKKSAKPIYYFIYKSHIIYYTPSKNRLTILALFHQSMAPENHLSLIH